MDETKSIIEKTKGDAKRPVARASNTDEVLLVLRQF